MTDSRPTSPAPDTKGAEPPAYRPLERFWPYVDLSEHPSDEELAALSPELAAALFGSPPGPFSLTLVFPAFEGPEYARAMELARGSVEHREVGSGTDRRHRARFRSSDAARIQELWGLIGDLEAAEVLIDDQPVPYARELWLPLLWLLLR